MNVQDLTPETIKKLHRIARMGSIALSIGVIAWLIVESILDYRGNTWADVLQLVVLFTIFTAFTWRWRYLGGMLSVALSGLLLWERLGWLLYYSTTDSPTWTNQIDGGVAPWVVITTLWTLFLAFGVLNILVIQWKQREIDTVADSGPNRRIVALSPRAVKRIRWIGRFILVCFALLMLAAILINIIRYTSSYFERPNFSVADGLYGTLSLSLIVVIIGFSVFKWPLFAGLLAIVNTINLIYVSLYSNVSTFTYIYSRHDEFDTVLIWVTLANLVIMLIPLSGGVLSTIYAWWRREVGLLPT